MRHRRMSSTTNPHPRLWLLKSRYAGLFEKNIGTATATEYGASQFAIDQVNLVDVRWTLRTGVADRVQHVLNCCYGLFGRKTKRRLFTSDEKGPLAGMRIGAVLHPAVCLAFADSVNFEQNASCPSLVCAKGRAPFPGHQHEFVPAQHETNP